MIIDCHGHYTTAPAQLQQYRDAQLAALADPSLPGPALAAVSDDQLRDSVEGNQLRVLRERGGDLMIFSPKASGMEHHVADAAVARAWAVASNDLVGRVADLFPQHFAPVAQLPQTPGGGVEDAVAELRRCVQERGFVGCNINPDPSGGHWSSPPLTDESWFPLFEAMVELDVPGMVHVSTSCNPAVHTLGAHYLNAHTTVLMQLLGGSLFERFPTLRLVVPHGGGAVPYHWGRYRGLAVREGREDPAAIWRNVFLDTAVYHQPGMDLLLRVVPASNVLFASEMLGAVRGADPETGVEWDDTLRYLEQVDLADDDRQAVLSGNALRVYPRLQARLQAAGVSA